MCTTNGHIVKKEKTKIRQIFRETKMKIIKNRNIFKPTY